MEKNQQFYRKLYKIRKFEENLLELFSQNKLNGTTHTCIGQEAIAVAVMNNVGENDYVFSNHRCHGHFLAYEEDQKLLLSEIMGKENGVCKGFGGSQHLCHKNFYTNGVQGGIVPNATGMAWSQKIQNKNGVAVVFIGDGTLGQGVIYESFNLAALYSLPVLYVVEDNSYAMSTSNKQGVAGSIKKRFEAFGIKSEEVESNDVEILDEYFQKAFTYIREKNEPFCQVVHTYRLGPHSKGDDTRDKDEIDSHKVNDPIILAGDKLSKDVKEKIEKEVEAEIKAATLECEKYKDAFELPQAKEYSQEKIFDSLLSSNSQKGVTALNEALKHVLDENNDVVILGEDIKDPYGGAFKITKGLSELFPQKLFNTPISEAGFVGCGVGIAMNGLKPIIEMMFGDFISLGFDQLLNHASKYHTMYAGKVDVPMLVRIPSGGGRGYGATHSQSLEKFLSGVPELDLIALSQLHNPEKLLKTIIKNIKKPTILLENKKMYGQKTFEVKENKIGQFFVEESEDLYPVYRLTLDKKSTADISIVTYGAMSAFAMNLAEKLLLEDEILVDVIVNTSISPVNEKSLKTAIGNVKKICTLEEGTKRLCWGTEIIAKLNESLKNREYKRIAAKNSIIPVATNLEKLVLPNEEESYKLLKGWING